MLTKPEEQAKQYRDGIRQFLKRTPVGIAKWPYQQAVKFKEDCKRAEKVANGSKSSVEQLYQAYRDLSMYY